MKKVACVRYVYFMITGEFDKLYVSKKEAKVEI